MIMILSFLIQGFFTIYNAAQSDRCLSLAQLRLEYPIMANMTDEELYTELLLEKYNNVCIEDLAVKYTIINL